MDSRLKPGFSADELKPRYDVSIQPDDAWHQYGDRQKVSFVKKHIDRTPVRSGWALNAGAGSNPLPQSKWDEVAVDIFWEPLKVHKRAVCASVEALPFPDASFDFVACIGEVLSYCDPARALRECARVLGPGGTLLFDFGNSNSLRYLFTPGRGLAATISTVDYNGAPEKVWVYEMNYISSILNSCDLQILDAAGIHIWSALGLRMKASPASALRVEKLMRRLPSNVTWADLIVVAACRN